MYASLLPQNPVIMEACRSSLRHNPSQPSLLGNDWNSWYLTCLTGRRMELQRGGWYHSSLFIVFWSIFFLLYLPPAHFSEIVDCSFGLFAALLWDGLSIGLAEILSFRCQTPPDFINALIRKWSLELLFTNKQISLCIWVAPPLLPPSPAAGEAGRKFSMKQRRHAAW